MGRKNKERKYIDERRVFTWEEKQEMLLKSGGKCAHCGQKIAGSDVSAEHMIPLSKGGTNDADNLVALCHECNDNKANFVYEPKSYYKHLQKEELKKAQEHFEKYLSTVNWLSLTNMYPSDEFEVIYYIITKDRHGHPKALRSKIKVHKASNLSYRQDREKLHEYIEKYNKKHGIDCEGDELRLTIESYLERGCIYYVGDLDNIKLVMPVRIENHMSKRHQKEHYVLAFGNPIYLNDTPTCADLANGIVYEIGSRIKDLAKKCGVQTMPVCIEYLENNTWYQTSIRLMTSELDPQGRGLFEAHAKLKAKLQEMWGGEIPEGEFGATTYISNSLVDGTEDIEEVFGDAIDVIDNENLTRWDRFIQKFCGTENIFDCTRLPDISEFEV